MASELLKALDPLARKYDPDFAREVDPELRVFFSADFESPEVSFSFFVNIIVLSLY
jgi:hypothetical protein